MNKLLAWLGLKPKDLIAGVVFIGLIGLKIAGKNGGSDTAMALILGYYFAHRQNGDDNGH